MRRPGKCKKPLVVILYLLRGRGGHLDEATTRGSSAEKSVGGIWMKTLSFSIITEDVGDGLARNRNMSFEYERFIMNQWMMEPYIVYEKIKI